MATGEARGMGKLSKGSDKNNRIGAFEGFNRDLLSGEGFTGFLDSGGTVSLEMDEQLGRTEMGFVYSPPFHEQASEMLNFLDNHRRNPEIARKSGISGSDSSSTSSSNNSLPISLRAESEQKRRAKLDHGSVSGEGSGSVTGSLEHGSNDSNKTLKKPKTEINPSSTGHLKVRKEKLGERISALQQLVSPFGKTDTASVLHEAMGYIRFLHDQIQVLSSPFLQQIPSLENGEENSKNELRNRGLCLVPVSCTLHVANSNGADFWAPARGSNTTKH